MNDEGHEEGKPAMATQTIPTFIRRFPLIAAVSLAILWGLVYLAFGVLHGMWSMFDQEFPFVVARLLGVVHSSMSPLAGAAFAMLDGALAGGLLGWGFRKVLVHW